MTNQWSDGAQTVEKINLPSITVSEMTFSDGTLVELNPDDIVVLVGPNNAGKSATLREIESLLGKHANPCRVITEIRMAKSGTLNDLEAAFEAHSYKAYHNGNLHYRGSGYDIPARQLSSGWESRFELLRNFFCRRLKTESRILDSNPAPSFKVLTEPASMPIQMLYANSEIEERISGYFRTAFNCDLIVMKAGGNEIPLLVGERVPLEEREDPTQKSYLERLMKKTTPLQEQGDGMRSFASVILEMLANQAPSMLLLDDPEAFLPPPQARLLGEFLARERRGNAQLFIATHSPDVLTGLLSEAPEQLRVIRIQRDGDRNRVKELQKEKAKAIAADPLMKYSAVLSGIFHERAIICEADADCMFYQALLAQPSVHVGAHPDVLFLHASGKHRMATMGEALRALGVPVDVIADVDLLKEKNSFQKLVIALGGDWALVEPLWNTIKLAIESRKSWFNADAVIKEIRDKLDEIGGRGEEFPEAAANDIRSTLKKSSPWGAVKDAGDAAIPSGDPTQRLNKLRAYLESIGIWIVPVGELEGFCRSIGGHGPKWVQRVIEDRELSSDPELEEARNFIKAIWSRNPTFDSDASA